MGLLMCSEMTLKINVFSQRPMAKPPVKTSASAAPAKAPRPGSKAVAAGKPSSGRKVGISLFVKFSVITALVIGVTMAGVTWFVYSQESQDLGREVRERGATIAKNLAANEAEAMITGDDLTEAVLTSQSVQSEGLDELNRPQPDLLHQVWRDLVRTRQQQNFKNFGVLEATVTDANGVILSDSDRTRVQQKYQAPAFLQAASPPDNPYPIYLYRGHRVFDIAVPIVQKQTGQHIGMVHLALRSDLVGQAVGRAATRIVALALAMLVLALLFTLLMVRVLLKPVDFLVQGVKAVSEGEFGRAIPVRRNDELGDLVEAYNGMTRSLAENETLKAAFSKYTSSALMNELLTDPSKLTRLGGERKMTTCFFSLVHGIHAVAETMDPEEFVQLLNEYLTAQTDVIARYHGHIDKFVREEVMAVWGVPQPNPDHAYLACAAGVECQQAVERLNAGRRARGQETFGVSIGINSGEVVSGNMGSQQKFDFTVIGDTVNTAARLMANGRPGVVMISEATHSLVKDRAEVEALEPIRVKGKKEPLQVYDVKSVKGRFSTRS